MSGFLAENRDMTYAKDDYCQGLLPMESFTTNWYDPSQQNYFIEPIPQEDAWSTASKHMVSIDPNFGFDNTTWSYETNLDEYIVPDTTLVATTEADIGNALENSRDNTQTSEYENMTDSTETQGRCPCNKNTVLTGIIKNLFSGLKIVLRKVLSAIDSSHEKLFEKTKSELDSVQTAQEMSFRELLAEVKSIKTGQAEFAVKICSELEKLRQAQYTLGANLEVVDQGVRSELPALKAGMDVFQAELGSVGTSLAGFTSEMRVLINGLHRFSFDVMEALEKVRDGQVE
ncbi:hypothetical protein PVAG01_05976 [Phlyctema vagabunda]|uniref:Uncharacterized protein n=1 Tax=Phlyctema vagabunda TaxID=108571 RepID=A0ABR4PEY1_9HELO